MALVGSGTPHSDLILQAFYPVLTRNSDGETREYKWRGPTATITDIAPQPGDICPDDSSSSCQSVRIEYFNATDSFVEATYSQSTITFGGGDQHEEGDIEEGVDADVDTQTDVEGDEYPYFSFKIYYAKWVRGWTNYERMAFAEITNHTNSYSWYGGGAGKWLCTGTTLTQKYPDQKQTSNTVYKRTTYFSYRSDGWDTTKYPAADFDDALDTG